MSGIEMNFDDRTPAERELDGWGNADEDTATQRVHRQGPPGEEIMLDQEPAPVERPTNVEPFKSEAEMADAWSKEAEGEIGFLKVDRNPAYAALVEARTLASMGTAGRWDDVVFKGDDSDQMMEAPLARLEVTPDSAMIQLD